MQDIALIMALHCVRNTIIEHYHVSGNLTDSEMKALNKEVTEKIYSFLELLLNPHYTEMKNTMLFSEGLSQIFYMPNNWDMPKFDKDFLAAYKIIKKQKATKGKIV